MNIFIVWLLILIAAIVGFVTGYAIGREAGSREIVISIMPLEDDKDE